MELVGTCVKCGTNVYCRDGFLDGVVDDGTLYCHSCWERKSAPSPENGGNAGKTSETR